MIAGLSGAVSRDVLAIKALALAQLVVGFVGGIVVARLAIIRLGIEGYSDFAFVLGFAATFALCDLGMIPGLTTVLGARLRTGERDAARGLTGAACAVTAGVWLVIAAGSLGFLHVAFPSIAGRLTIPLCIFAWSSGLVGVADVAATLLRVDGALAFAYACRIAYQVVWIGGVAIAFVALPRWDDVTVLTIAQLVASIVFAGAMGVRIARVPYRGLGVLRHWRAEVQSEGWLRAWRLSAPERGVRVLGAALTLGERSFLLALGATALLGSYDLLLRIAVLISAVPAALAQPLLSILAAGHANGEDSRAYTGASAFTARASAILATLGLVAATVIWVFFGESLFSVRPVVPLALALCVFLATALNVLTATGVAVLTFEGNVTLVKRKLAFEVVGVVLGVAAGIATVDATWFIGVRYATLGLAAALFLAQYRGVRSRTREIAT